MNIIRNLPGPLLIFLGALSLSFGGLLVKSFEGASSVLVRRPSPLEMTALFYYLSQKTGRAQPGPTSAVEAPG